MNIIKEEQIIEKVKKIRETTDNLSESVSEFTNYVEQISEVIEGLKVYFNTTSGLETVQEIDNIEFDIHFLNNISKKASDVEVKYYKEKKKLF